MILFFWIQVIGPWSHSTRSVDLFLKNNFPIHLTLLLHGNISCKEHATKREGMHIGKVNGQKIFAVSHTLWIFFFKSMKKMRHQNIDIKCYVSHDTWISKVTWSEEESWSERSLIPFLQILPDSWVTPAFCVYLQGDMLLDHKQLNPSSASCPYLAY